MPARRRFGSVRRLPSGRWQARYWDAADNRVGAPTTFATKGDAQRWLSATETDMGRGRLARPSPRRRSVPRVVRTVDGHEVADGRTGHAGPLPLLAAQARRPALRRDARRPDHRERGAGVARRPTSQRAEPEHCRQGIPLPQAARWTVPSTPGSSLDHRARSREPAPSATPRCRSRHPNKSPTLAAAVGPRWEALVFAAAYTGLRWGELAGLRRCDVDLERNLVTVTRQAR